MLAGFGKPRGVTGDPHGTPHEGAERLADVREIERLLAVAELNGGDLGNFEGSSALRVECPHDVLGRSGAVDESFEKAVRREPVRAVEPRAGHFARRPEAG